MRYLNPIRMYVFISAIFFLALYADKGEEDGKVNNADSVNVIRQQIADSLRRAGGDSAQRASNLKLAAKLDTAGKDSAKAESLSVAYTTGGIVKADITERKYHTVREYDSVQRTLPDSAKAKGIMKWILRNNVRMKEKYGTSVIHKEVDIRHDIPKVMFVLLPLFALYVGWLYSRKKYYYVQHAIFSVHFHCFYFLLFLVLLLVGILIRTDWYELLSPMVAVVAGYFYLVVALRNRFRQSWMTSFLKGTAIAGFLRSHRDGGFYGPDGADFCSAVNKKPRSGDRGSCRTGGYKVLSTSFMLRTASALLAKKVHFVGVEAEVDNLLPTVAADGHGYAKADIVLSVFRR
jgi:hypothetical protein